MSATSKVNQAAKIVGAVLIAAFAMASAGCEVLAPAPQPAPVGPVVPTQNPLPPQPEF